jgi:hypothetical protein
LFVDLHSSLDDELQQLDHVGVSAHHTEANAYAVVSCENNAIAFQILGKMSV